MAAEKKKPDEDDVTSERAYVPDKRSCSLFSLSRREAGPRPESPSPVRAHTATGYRHQRKNAVRERRSASQNRPKPGQERATGYVDTSFVTAAGGKGDRDGAAVAPEPAAAVPDGQQQPEPPEPARPFIDFASISEEELMKSVGPSTRLDDGIEEFPAYVPWKAAYTWPENTPEDGGTTTAAVAADGRTVTCYVCKRCRCSVCQKKCKYLQTTAFGVDVSPSNAFVDALEFLPCVKKTARCVAYDDRTTAAAAPKWFGNPFANHQRHQRPADNAWPMMGLLRVCLPCVGPYRPLNGAEKCAGNCTGNIRVAGCKCMDWDAVRQGRRVRGQDSAYYAALSSSTAERRRRYQDQRLADTTTRAVKAAKTIAAAKAAADTAKSSGDTAKSAETAKTAATAAAAAVSSTTVEIDAAATIVADKNVAKPTVADKQRK